MDIQELVSRLIQEAAFLQIVNNPVSQFGTQAEPLLGASLLPEQPVDENAYVEEAIRYRSVIANDGTRYSPVQIKEGIAVGSMQVILGNSDIGSHFTGQQYDALLRIIRRFQPGTTPSMAQIQNLINWVDTTLSMPLRMKNELQRWQAIVTAQVLRQGDGGYRETVNYPNPAGHRVNAGGVWSNNAYDPWADIIAQAELLRSKGFTVNRILTGTPVLSKLTLNEKVRMRLGILTLAGGVTVGLPGRADLESVNAALRRDNLPPIEVYDGQYRTQTGSGYYLARNAFVMLATTGRDETVLGIDDRPLILQNTLGYTAIGRPAGQAGPGRAIVVTPFANKPPRVEGEAWQTSLPVITEPEAIAVIGSIS
jgi:hypothetical protein